MTINSGTAITRRWHTSSITCWSCPKCRASLAGPIRMSSVLWETSILRKIATSLVLTLPILAVIRAPSPEQPFGFAFEKTGRRSSHRHGLGIPRDRRAAPPKPLVCGFVDNLPAANRAACPAKRFEFLGARPPSPIAPGTEFPLPGAPKADITRDVRWESHQTFSRQAARCAPEHGPQIHRVPSPWSARRHG